MAKATVIKGGKLRVLLGNSATPIVYTSACGLTTRTLSLTKETTTINIPDCDDPDAIDWVGRGATSLSMGISGDGVLAVESFEKWLDAVESSESTPVKVEMEFPTKTITWTGYMQIESVEITANNGETVGLSMSMNSDNEMVRTSVNNP